ncbi:MAG: PilT/PilU family type 4a pilus ATPase [Alphaproteobacteria bacterium]|nr:PilT/PilU family type 4a pilus ATPase [Alphaproteobacteria bacterium]
MSAPIIFNYLNAMNDHNASDLYITVGYPPTLRGDTAFIQLDNKHLSADDINDILNSILTSRQKRTFETEMELNTSLDMGQYGRFRINVLRQRQFPALVIRRIISTIPTFEQLKLPRILERLSLEKRGLVMITGMTGSGKSTTLAAMVDYRNMMAEGHIITIEDPIEYFHDHKKCVVTQREVGVDTESYAAALKNALRQRPDVILVGEIRDQEVMEQALMSAETGHLCLATIHTTNAYQAIERVVNLFPEDYGHQIRLNLSGNLKAIVSQRLVPAIAGGYVPAIEVMINQGLVRELIMKGEITKIKDVMEQNNSLGMCTFDQSLMRLFSEGLISEETAISNSDKPSDMKIRVNQIKLSSHTDGSNKKEKADALRSMDTSVLKLRD